MEKDPSLSSPLYSLRSDSPHQWSEHGLGTTSAGLWVTHNNDPITIPSLPPPLLIGVSDDRVKGADGTTLLEAHGEFGDRRWSHVLASESIDIIDEVRQEVRAAHNKFYWETVDSEAPSSGSVPSGRAWSFGRGSDKSFPWLHGSFTTSWGVCHEAT